MRNYCSRVTFLVLAILLVAQTQAQPCAHQGRAHPGISAELHLSKVKFKNGEPIIVDVYLENSSREDIRQNQFSPLSSAIGLPDFLITPLQQGDGIGIPPGLFVTPDWTPVWDDWYQPAAGRDAYRVGDFVLPAGKRIHLLHGDLRLMIEQAREHCQRALMEDGSLMEKPDQASTKKRYGNIVRFAGQFLSGGLYELTVCAYVRSNTLRFEIERSTD